MTADERLTAPGLAGAGQGHAAAGAAEMVVGAGTGAGRAVPAIQSLPAAPPGPAAPPAPAAPAGPAPLPGPAAPQGAGRRPGLRGVGRWAGHWAWPVAVYAGSRLLLLAVAGLVAFFGHRSLVSEFYLFDGEWYLRLAQHGYPPQALHGRSTLGFFPLYPLTIRGTAWVTGLSLGLAALAVSMLGGLVSAVLVQRLAASWWGQAVGGWAVLLFSLFPGSVVFSMAYSECLLIPLAVGCLLALRYRRWWVAGILAGLATAVEPIAVILVAVCLAAAARELRARGWRDRQALRSLAAPLLSPLGIGAFAVFLWAWTGTPFAAYLAQHYGWHQQSEPLAFFSLPIVRYMLAHPHQLIAHLLIWNVWNGVLGGVFLVSSVVALVRLRRKLPVEALLLAGGVTAATLWSIMTPPNARMAIVAFPAVIVWARRLAGPRLMLFTAAEVAVLIGSSALTFSGHMLP